jgi:hypothetical protein
MAHADFFPLPRPSGFLAYDVCNNLAVPNGRSLSVTNRVHSVPKISAEVELDMWTDKISVSTEAKISCDYRRCDVLAAQIKLMALPVPREDVPPLPFSKQQEANFWFFLAAICHQTSPLGLQG